MKFKLINGTLIASCQEAHEFLALCMDEVELFSKEGLRTLAQNRKLWPLLRDISTHVTLFGCTHTPEIWKHIISAAHKDQYFVKGITGSLVVIPVKTSNMSKKEFSIFIEEIYSYGSGEGVNWSDPAMAAYEEYHTRIAIAG